ncbi:DNA/RNA non-specific endonuclease [Aerococcus urinae]|uniref:DNA/RNA non-specific endonuclease n=1 Tax=Aerococcus urinae TaxID=1376 RepID=UPI00227C92B4|nr:DNA/RNA non-specific endonuclease [Aerococcus urinae]MCY3060562.1 DNA/RNA non-specific endonuclease [Aerococcus urinae]
MGTLFATPTLFDHKENTSNQAAVSQSASKSSDSNKEKAKSESESKKSQSDAEKELSKTREVPQDKAYVEVNNNKPFFTDDDLKSSEAYEKYGDLDKLGRVTAANAVLGTELMPDKVRESISEVKPTGWKQARYVNIPGGWLYNRCHLIGYQLTGENANPKNLMTGTHWFNNEGMLPFENFVANYIEKTNNHVRYRVTPVFEGKILLASGIYMEGYSIEDEGKGLCFNIYIPNRQKDVEINYADGSSKGPAGPQEYSKDTQLEKLPQSESKAKTENKTESEKPSPAAEDTARPEAEDKPADQASAQEPAPSPAPAPEPVQPPAPAPAPQPVQAQGPQSSLAGIDTDGNGIVTIKEARAAGFSMPIRSDHWLYPYMIDRDGDGMVGE